MDIGFNHREWRATQECGRDLSPDWHALRSRLTSARAAHQALKLAPSAAGTARVAAGYGSFSRKGAQLLAAASHRPVDVNLSPSDYRKRELEKVFLAAGTLTTGGRG